MQKWRTQFARDRQAPLYIAKKMSAKLQHAASA